MDSHRKRPSKSRTRTNTYPKDNEVVIEVAYAAVNPTDWKMQDIPYFSMPYPWIFGADVSGTIVQLGAGVDRFRIGQRVMGQCDGILTRTVQNTAFQLYATCSEILVAVVPDEIPLASAAVLPLATSTAAAGLFKILRIPLPVLDPKPAGKTILIWGGSSSCGASAIQLAKAAGYTVVTTAGTQNHDFVKTIGATYVFDHKSPTVIQDILAILQIGDAIFDCIALASTQQACAEVAHKIGARKFAALLPPVPNEYNVEPVMVNGLDVGLVDFDIGDAVWRKYVPEALVKGKYLAKPDPEVLEGGLGRVQDGIDLLRNGVSAKKVVIEITKQT
ncbi:putative zinc-binding oxidoreductase protein [Botrytis fragariae]|uniref:Putative zinc-binding oxidoreductase protein n=1 Tax=Botrytis fragariae TaxID=1964551 RepID=A0A8H6AIL0_9HELO|nr:putative zinc-binding oxidoreductase protein [Botrytis fragariae]KAF5867950.1 putative zinc-binding oxidoreductase protein [Botrytis fragariae]